MAQIACSHYPAVAVATAGDLRRRACWGEWEEFGGRSAREEKERGRDDADLRPGALPLSAEASGNASTVSTRNLSGGVVPGRPGSGPLSNSNGGFGLSAQLDRSALNFFFLWAADQTKDHGTKVRCGGKLMGAKERKTPWKKREKEVSGKL